MRQDNKSGIKILYNVIQILSEFINGDNLRMREYINYVDSLGKGDDPIEENSKEKHLYQ